MRPVLLDGRDRHNRNPPGGVPVLEILPGHISPETLRIHAQFRAKPPRTY
jgi:hypothetical protein